MARRHAKWQERTYSTKLCSVFIALCIERQEGVHGIHGYLLQSLLSTFVTAFNQQRAWLWVGRS